LCDRKRRSTLPIVNENANMPLFTVSKSVLQPVTQSKFTSEKALQQLVESNLEVVFNCRFVATEFPTGAQHAGRIDTLALSEDQNPVIIEYKNVESSDLINQSLFYLSWIHDHRGDFEIAVQRALGPKIDVDWGDVRVICIAPNYRKYDLHAVRVMGANIELWTYRLFANGVLYFEEILQKSDSGVNGAVAGKNPVMVAAGKKAAAARATGSYTFEQHLDGKPDSMRQLAVTANDFIAGLDPAIEVAPKKFYIAYKTSQNIVCMEVQQQGVILYLKLDPKSTPGPKGISRDVSDVGHYGTGDLEISIKGPADFEAAKPLIQMAYEKVGG
jgi:predicted transport protein